MNVFAIFICRTKKFQMYKLDEFSDAKQSINFYRHLLSA